jgi:hypothetical protein
MMLIGKKSKEDQIAYLERMLKELAMERIGVRLDEQEKLLTRDLDKLRMESFGLGADSISAVAGLELTREQIQAERAAFEKFMQLLIPGWKPPVKAVPPHETPQPIQEDAEPGA